MGDGENAMPKTPDKINGRKVVERKVVSCDHNGNPLYEQVTDESGRSHFERARNPVADVHFAELDALDPLAAAAYKQSIESYRES